MATSKVICLTLIVLVLAGRGGAQLPPQPQKPATPRTSTYTDIALELLKHYTDKTGRNQIESILVKVDIEAKERILSMQISGHLIHYAKALSAKGNQ